MRIYYLLIVSLLWSCESPISTGLDNLKSTHFEILQHKRVGVIINHTSLDRDGDHIIELLAAESEIEVLKIFSPEHGYKGSKSAGEFIYDDIEPLTGAKIVSLYGVNKKPSPQELENIDGVSGATVKPWVEGKGIPIDYKHLDPSKQALIDFRDSILNNQLPESNVYSGSSTAITVDLALKAIHNERITYWRPYYNTNP